MSKSKPSYKYDCVVVIGPSESRGEPSNALHRAQVERLMKKKGLRALIIGDGKEDLSPADVLKQLKDGKENGKINPDARVDLFVDSEPVGDDKRVHFQFRKKGQGEAKEDTDAADFIKELAGGNDGEKPLFHHVHAWCEDPALLVKQSRPQLGNGAGLVAHERGKFAKGSVNASLNEYLTQLIKYKRAAGRLPTPSEAMRLTQSCPEQVFACIDGQEYKNYTALHGGEVPYFVVSGKTTDKSGNVSTSVLILSKEEGPAGPKTKVRRAKNRHDVNSSVRSILEAIPEDGLPSKRANPNKRLDEIDHRLENKNRNSYADKVNFRTLGTPSDAPGLTPGIPSVKQDRNTAMSMMTALNDRAASGRTMGGDSLYHILVRTGQTQELLQFERAGIYPDKRLKDMNGNTLLHVACESGRDKMVEFILNHQYTDANAVNNEGKNAFQVAIEHGRASIAARLFAAEGSRGMLDHVDNKGNSALHLAAANNDGRSVAELLHLGADFTLTNKDGKTAFDIAKESNHRGVCSIFHNVLNEAKDHKYERSSPLDKSSRAAAQRTKASKNERDQSTLHRGSPTDSRAMRERQKASKHQSEREPADRQFREELAKNDTKKTFPKLDESSSTDKQSHNPGQSSQTQSTPNEALHDRPVKKLSLRKRLAKKFSEVKTEFSAWKKERFGGREEALVPNTKDQHETSPLLVPNTKEESPDNNTGTNQENSNHFRKMVGKRTKTTDQITQQLGNMSPPGTPSGDPTKGPGSSRC